MSKSPLRGMRFVGRPIDRAAVLSQRKDEKAVRSVQEGQAARFLLVSAKRVLAGPQEPPALDWWTRESLLQVHPGADAEAVYLGPLSAPGGLQAFAIDLGAGAHEKLALPQGARWLTGRELMLSRASEDDVTVAGLALALVGWHETARFHGRDGQPTLPVEGGMKRKAVNGSGKVYPRIDPVAIGLIVSPDRRRTLLGRSPTYPKGFYTCLSGFAEMCESAEEAFRREAFEEAGVELATVELLASQPWPIGRSGACELMIGCKAVAASDEFEVNLDELEDARWFTKAEARQLLDHTHPGGLRAPGEYALAHHLIRSWAVDDEAPRSLAAGGLAPSAALLAGLAGLVAGVALARLQSRM